ncbi:uncharacterized protein BDZ99DRAFT_459989 [Mytilinidion resinicola]|uniref:Uncharacterized protein n=1 Tax=Mytilinidion resinicola TaxID=574789 RepID=A0A6A6Z288_9PEZI|nr:uncharacterized protein BDZ99DRAFT_459989 [Mytilinidion resinicola]KAF2814295.1 hypothetical protein BDZ99DRAFT_459989 [Mytilinidion resinicola]
MYTGNYALAEAEEGTGVSTHAKIWVLADMLVAPRLQNLAMARLFAENISEPEHPERSKLLYVIDLRIMHFLYSNTTEESKLRRFFEDAVITHWDNPGMIEFEDGEDTEDAWDELLDENPIFRKALLFDLTRPRAARKRILRAMEAYFVGASWAHVHEKKRKFDELD